mmetsp:Transcript_33120/g.87957  ORF Transcript_33120/g.87957 Transcript_33120/m.87957 type:complete len:504 (+) Transcript_33120:113-1624(+)
MDSSSCSGSDVRGHYVFATQQPKAVAGILCTLFVVVLWVGSSELSQYIFDDADYSKPFFMTALNTSLFSVYLLGFLVCPSWRESTEYQDANDIKFSRDDSEPNACNSQPATDAPTEPLLLKLASEASMESEILSPHGDACYPMSVCMISSNSAVKNNGNFPDTPARDGSTSPHESAETHDLHGPHTRIVIGHGHGDEYEGAARHSRVEVSHDAADLQRTSSLCSAEQDALLAAMSQVPLPWYKVAALAWRFVWIWNLGGYLFNASLCFACGTGTSVSANQVISGTSALWALLLSCIFLGEEATGAKMMSVVASCVGAALVTGVDFAAGSGNSWQGDVLCALSATCHGLSSVLLKLWMPEEDAVNMPMFFGFIGLFTALASVPAVVLLHFTGIETFQPIPGNAALFLAINGIFGTVLSNLLWAKAVVLTSPLVVNLGTALSIPLAFWADAINPYGPPVEIKWQYIAGALLVAGAFLAVNIPTSFSDQRKRPRAISVGSASHLVC